MTVHEQPTELLQTLPVPAPPTPPAIPGGKRGRPRISRVVTIIAWLLVLLSGFLASVLILTPARETVLVMGTDARPDELAQGEIGRTDTMMLLVADRAQPKLATVSVPRDLWVSIPGYGQERINAAYEFGGAQTAEETITSVTGVPIQRYALIGLQGVRDVVDSVGGIDIDVKQAIHDDAYPTDDYGIMVVDIPAGPQHMDGATALEYARSRHQDNDFARAGRQQEVLAAVRSKLQNPLNWPRLPGFVSAVQRSVKTDVSVFDAVAITAAVLRHPSSPDQLVIDTQLATEETGDDGAYLLKAKPALKPTVAQFLGLSSTPQLARATVDVLNAAGATGLARTTADRLEASGYPVSSVADASTRQAQTTVEAHASAQSIANGIAGALGIPTSRVSTSSGSSLPPGTDVRVLVGSDLAGR